MSVSQKRRKEFRTAWHEYLRCTHSSNIKIERQIQTAGDDILSCLRVSLLSCSVILSVDGLNQLTDDS